MRINFFRRYSLEIFALLVAVVGGALFLGRDWLDQWLADAPVSLLDSLQQLDEEARTAIPYFIDNLGWSGLFGLGLILCGALFLVWRIRYRFKHSERMSAEVCPRCGDRLHRIHRSWFDRLLSVTLLPSARRYECANKSCGWQGLRRRAYHHHHRSSPASQE